LVQEISQRDVERTNYTGECRSRKGNRWLCKTLERPLADLVITTVEEELDGFLVL
jgi:hypothetical protein